MAYFAYKARNSGGDLVQGVLESTDSSRTERMQTDSSIVSSAMTRARKPTSAKAATHKAAPITMRR